MFDLCPICLRMPHTVACSLIATVQTLGNAFAADPVAGTLAVDDDAHVVTVVEGPANTTIGYWVACRVFIPHPLNEQEESNV